MISCVLPSKTGFPPPAVPFHRHVPTLRGVPITHMPIDTPLSHISPSQMADCQPIWVGADRRLSPWMDGVCASGVGSHLAIHNEGGWTRECGNVCAQILASM